VRAYLANSAALVSGEFPVGDTPVGKRAALTAGLSGEAVLAVRSVPADGRQVLYPSVTSGDLSDALRVVGA
jgi:hypothetical protein